MHPDPRPSVLNIMFLGEFEVDICRVDEPVADWISRAGAFIYLLELC